MFENVKYISCGDFISNGEWIHPDRTIDSYEIIYVLKGEVYINENETEYIVGKNEVIVLEPNLRHYGYKYSKNTEFLWLHWTSETDVSMTVKHKKPENQYNILLFFKQLLHNRTAKKADESFDYLTRLILIEINSGISQTDSNRLTEKIVSWTKANNYKPLSVADIAEHFGYNADYLNRKFKETYGINIKQYIDEERMKFIKGLLISENLTLSEIAERAGFTEYKYFLKFFKYHEDITPTQFRARYAKIYINTR